MPGRNPAPSDAYSDPKSDAYSDSNSNTDASSRLRCHRQSRQPAGSGSYWIVDHTFDSRPRCRHV